MYQLWQALTSLIYVTEGSEFCYLKLKKRGYNCNVLFIFCKFINHTKTNVKINVLPYITTPFNITNRGYTIIFLQ